MKREIKFRGKNTDTGKWVYGFLSFFYTAGRNKNGWIFTDKARIYSPEDCRCYDVWADTVGQFTEIPVSDSGDAEEIYEHDIVGFIDIDEHIMAEVIFEDGCFCFRDKDGQIYYPHNVDNISLLGNKFDNPDLLKGGSNEE